MVDVLEERKAEDIVLMDLREQNVFTDFFVICTATSERQLRALAEAVQDTARKQFRMKPPRVEGHAEGGWVLVDFGTLIIHCFSETQRKRYKLEELWHDGKVMLRIQ